MKVLLYIFCFSVILYGSDNLPEPDYSIRSGLGEKTKVVGDSTKKSINRQVAPKEMVTVDTKKVDLKNAYILQQINSEMGNKNISKSKQNVNLISLPKSYNQEKEYYTQQVALYNKQKTDAAAKAEAVTSNLLLLECLTFKEYKISTNGRFKMICTNPKNNSEYKISSTIGISQEGEVKLEAKPYLLEDDEGNHYNIDTAKSRLFNATSGSDNLATYIDKREVDNIKKEMAKTLAKETPEITKSYIDTKYSTESTVIQDGSTATVATTTPTPAIGDYGISLLINVLSTGISAGVEQLYQDLGYIYFIPKYTRIDAEIVYIENNKNGEQK